MFLLIILFVVIIGGYVIYILNKETSDKSVYTGTFTIHSNTENDFYDEGSFNLEFDYDSFNDNSVWIWNNPEEYDTSIFDYTLVKYAIKMPHMFENKFFTVSRVKTFEKDKICLLFKDFESGEELSDYRHFDEGATIMFKAFNKSDVEIS